MCVGVYHELEPGLHDYSVCWQSLSRSAAGNILSLFTQAAPLRCYVERAISSQEDTLFYFMSSAAQLSPSRAGVGVNHLFFALTVHEFYPAMNATKMFTNVNLCFSVEKGLRTRKQTNRDHNANSQPNKCVYGLPENNTGMAPSETFQVQSLGPSEGKYF